MACSHVNKVGALALALATAGCGALERVHECGRVIDVVNEGLGNLALQVPDAGSSTASYEEIATAYEQLKQRLVELAPEDSALQKAVAGYEEMIERAAANSRAFARELATAAPSKAAKKSRNQRLDRIRTLAQSELGREALLVRKINSLCHLQ